MQLFELYKVLPDGVEVLIYDSKDEVIYYGSLNKLDIDIMQSRITYLRPTNPREIVVKIDI